MSLSPEERQLIEDALAANARAGETRGASEAIWIAAKNYGIELAAAYVETIKVTTTSGGGGSHSPPWHEVHEESGFTKPFADAIRALKDKHG